MEYGIRSAVYVSPGDAFDADVYGRESSADAGQLSLLTSPRGLPCSCQSESLEVRGGELNFLHN